MPQKPRLISAGTALLVGAAVLSTAPTASAATAWPSHVMAPYVDAGLSNTTLTTVASATGDKFFTLAFVDGAGCSWSMYNTSTWQTQIANLRAAGGDVSISFGGWTTDSGGTDLGNTCSSASAAATQIENVVTTFNVTHLDFDIESIALSNHADVDRTNQALAQVRSWAGSTGRSLSVSYTVPVFTSGLSSDGQYLLSSASSAGFTPDLINAMAMDYGTSGTEMGTAANQALDATASQVASQYGLSSSAAYAKTGVTPMIGQNDSAGEIFTVADASTVESHAASVGAGELAYWSAGRDNGGCPGTTSASSTCSGVSQSSYQFNSLFEPFTGGTGSSGGGSGPITSAIPGKCVDNNAQSTTDGNRIQLWTCNGTVAQVWTVNSNGSLTVQGKCMDVTYGGTSNGTKIQLWGCNNTGSQVWQYNSSTGALVNPQSGRCLDDPSSSTTDGTQLQIWDCNGTNAQHWTLP